MLDILWRNTIGIIRHFNNHIATIVGGFNVNVTFYFSWLNHVVKEVLHQRLQNGFVE